MASRNEVAPHLEILLLGPPCVKINHKLLNIPRRLERALIFYLGAMHFMQPVEAILELFWDGFSRERASHNLSNVIYRANSHIAAEAGTNASLIYRQADFVYLNTKSFALGVDLAELDAAHRSVTGSSENDLTVNRLERALNLYRGEFLKGFYLETENFAKWSFLHREKYMRLYIQLLQYYAGLSVCENRIQKAIALYHQILEADEYNEEAYYALMRLYYQRGSKIQGDHVFFRYKNLLKKDLNVEPSGKILKYYYECNPEAQQNEERNLLEPASDSAPDFTGKLSVQPNTRIWEMRAAQLVDVADFNCAIREYRKILPALVNESEVKPRAHILYLLGRTYLWNHNYKQAESCLQKSFKLAMEHNYNIIQIKAAIKLSLLYNITGKFERASYYNQILLEASKNLTLDNQTRHDIIFEISRKSLWKGQVAQARMGFEEALRLALKTGSRIDELISRQFLAIACAGTGRYDHALRLLQQSLGKSDYLGNAYLRAMILNTIGWIFQELGDYSVSSFYNSAASELLQKSNWLCPLGYSITNLGYDYYYLGDSAAALRTFARALEISNVEGYLWRWRHPLLAGFAAVYLREEEFAAALKYTREALSYAQKNKNPKYTAKSLILLARIWLRKGKHERAYQCALEAVKYAGASGHLLTAAESFGILAGTARHFNLYRANSALQNAEKIIARIAAHITDETLQRAFYGKWNARILRDSSDGAKLS